jgi:hypothetical protein
VKTHIRRWHPNLSCRMWSILPMRNFCQKRVNYHRQQFSFSVNIPISASAYVSKDKIKWIEFLCIHKTSISSSQFTLTLWNPTIHPAIDHVRVPVTKKYLIRDPMGQTVPAEVRRSNRWV